jgi:hypothetical protein
MSVKSRHLLLLFYKNLNPAMQNLKDASMVEVCSNFSQPGLHGFLDCLINLVVVICQVIFQGPGQVVV